jgi:hypothetical protein
VKTFVAGLPVVVAVRAPDAAEMKKMVTMVNKNKDHVDAKIAAVRDLAEVCWVYPEDKETRKAMCEANAGLHSSIGNFAYSLGEVELKEEGKG